jgi:curved DNA-binding protein CbpA
VLYPLSPEKLLLEGVREQYPSDRVNLEFTGIERKLFRTSDGLKGVLSQFGLPPATIRFLERLPSEIRFSSAIQQSKLKADAAQALLLALYFGGYLTLSEEDEDFPLGRAYAAAEPRARAEKPAAVSRPEKKEEAKKEAPGEEPKLAIEERLDREMSNEELIKEIDRFLELVSRKDTTYFDIMGVDRNVPPAKIKKIYFKMAKVFHPDSHPDLFKDELRSRVEALFTRISEAYDALTDTQKREAYIKQTFSKVSAEEMEKANRAVTAELEFQKAEVLLKRGAFAKAGEMLDQVVKLMPEEQEYRIYQAWAMYKTEGPGRAQAARQIIEKALKERGNNKDGYFYLGMINRAEGRTDEAIKHFQKVIELDPYNTEAQRELRVLTMRKDKGTEKGGRFGRRR